MIPTTTTIDDGKYDQAAAWYARSVQPEHYVAFDSLIHGADNSA